MIITDSFLSENDFKKIYTYCYTEKYEYGEQDNPDTPVTGMIHQLDKNNSIFKLIDTEIKNKKLIDKDSSVIRMYINCFAPAEMPYYHRDESEWTFLLYVNDYMDINNGGETIFIDGDNIIGVLPIQNRLLKFKGSMLHKATANRYNHRFTIAIKY